MPPSPEPCPIVLEGWGVHSGEPSRVVLARGAPGAPVAFRVRGFDLPLPSLRIASTARATTVEGDTPEGPVRIGTVEHLLGALAGLSVYASVVVEVEGPELPLLDGGASCWVAAIDGLGVGSAPAPLRVARHAAFDVGESRYEWLPGATSEVLVTLDVDDRRLAAGACWTGAADDFVRRIASARTFAWARDIAPLAASGLARRVDPASVVLVAPDAIHCAGRPFEADEPARHKLLDLLGDLYLCGGVPAGTVRATRPGHAANATACRLARGSGVLVPR